LNFTLCVYLFLLPIDVYDTVPVLDYGFARINFMLFLRFRCPLNSRHNPTVVSEPLVYDIVHIIEVFFLVSVWVFAARGMIFAARVCLCRKENFF
jgi:hypothetical protein